MMAPEPDRESRLRDLLVAAVARGPVLVLIEGRAGMGKTRLVNALLNRPTPVDRPWTVVSFPSAGPPVFRRRANPAAAQPTGRPPAGAQPPARPSDPPARRPPPSLPDALRAAELSELAGLADTTEPVLLVAEDVHRAGEEARALLRRLLAHPAARISTVLTYRPEELEHPGLPLGSVVDYPSDLDVVRIRLEPLSAEQVRRWAGTALGERRCSAEFTDRLYERTGGVAQVVADLLRRLEDGGQRDRYTARDVDASPVPVRLAELTIGRLSAVPQRHRGIVEAAAVLEEPAEEQELAEAAGLTAEEGQQALLAALAAAALDECPGATYGFSVPLAARAIRQMLPGPTRRELHHRAAELLARRVPTPWVRLAHHQRSCGELPAWLDSVEAAATEAAAAGRHQVAIGLLEEALADPSVPTETRARLAPALAHSASVGLRSDQTVEVLRRAVDELDLPTGARGAIRLDLALVLGNQVGRSAEGRAELERAAEELRERPALAARAMSALAMPSWPVGTLAENLDWLKRAEAIAAGSGDAVVQAAVAANRASVLLSIGDPEGWRCAEELPHSSEDPACRQHAARGLCNCADAAVWLGEYRRSADLLAQGLELAVSSGQSYAEQTGRGTKLLLDWATGRWTGLRDRAAEFVAEAGEMPWIAADAQLVLGMLALARGEWSQVTARLSGAGLPAPEDGAVPLVATAAGARIRLALARQDLGLAATEATRAWDRLRAKGVWVWAAEPAPWAVEAVISAGLAEQAREMVAEFATGLKGRQAPAAEAALEWCRAHLAEAADEPERAVEHFRQARAAYAALPRRYEAALAGEAAARCALAAWGGADLAALNELKAVEGELEQLGAVWDAARARATLRDHRVEERRPPGRPAYGEQLSPREEEVAALAGAGLTNRDIAATLHLSPRTVEQHVARAIRKLGVQSRLDLGRKPD